MGDNAFEFLKSNRVSFHSIYITIKKEIMTFSISMSYYSDAT